MWDGFSGYDLLHTLAARETSALYLARDRGTGARSALEIFSSSGPEAEALVATARAWREVEHPNLARVLASGALPDGRAFVACEWLDGVTLAEQLRRHGPLAPDDAAPLLLPLCDALEDAHRRGLVHGDIRPGRIFLSGGLAALSPRLLWAQSAGAAATPEAVSRDLAALGRVLLEAIAGGERDALEALGVGAAWLGPIIDRCLQEEPSRRFQSAAELSRALQSLRTGTISLLSTAASLTPPQADDGDDEGPVEGEVLGNYELLRLIGEGSMGRVFLARHTRLERQVALKVLKPEHARSSEVVARFFHEARTVNRINHEHIVEVFDFVEDRDRNRACCVMELLSGVSLRSLLAREKLTVTRVVAIVRQLCDALEAAHRLGVVHRDVKPDNIFITQRAGQGDFVKVLDFGVAKLLSPVADAPATGTVEGMIIGTPAYMSPEQASGLAVDHRSDIYSVGTVLYEMLAGRVPFEGAVFGQLAAAILTRPPPPLPKVAQTGEPIAAELAELVRWCLAKEPDSRPTSMQALSAALERFEQGVPIKRTRRVRWSTRATATAATVASVVAVATGGALSVSGAPAESARPSVAAVVRREAPRPPTPTPGVERVRIEVLSEPPGASVRDLESGLELGTTPLSAELPKRTGEVTLRLEKDGFVPFVRRVQLDVEGAVKVILPERQPEIVSASGSEPAPVKAAVGKGRGNRDAVVDPFEL